MADTTGALCLVDRCLRCRLVPVATFGRARSNRRAYRCRLFPFLRTPNPMSVKFSSIAANLTKERDGEYREVPEWPSVKLGVRSLHNPAYQLARDALIARYVRKKPSPVQRQIDAGRLYATHILFGWDGFSNEDGTPLVYTPELAMEKMTNPEYRELVQKVEAAATEVGESEIEFIEEATKN